MLLSFKRHCCAIGSRVQDTGKACTAVTSTVRQFNSNRPPVGGLDCVSPTSAGRCAEHREWIRRMGRNVPAIGIVKLVNPSYRCKRPEDCDWNGTGLDAPPDSKPLLAKAHRRRTGTLHL